MKRILLIFIKIYQKTLSLDHGFAGKIFPNTRICIYTPSCSEYSYQAISKYGAIKGTYLGIKRILSCAPWGKGGYDPLR